MDYSTYTTIAVEKRDRIIRLTLNRPESLNAVNHQMHTELASLFKQIQSDDEVAVVTLTGAGRGFCAGGDRKSLVTVDLEAAGRVMAEAREILENILDVDKPIICGLNGPAAGFGATLALFCDVVIASEHARIGDTHVHNGLSAGDGGAVIWPLLVGVNKAKEMLMTGDLVDAKEAHRMGLVNQVVPGEKLEETVIALAEGLAKGPAKAVQYSKKPINQYLKWMMSLVFDYSCALEGQIALEMMALRDKLAASAT